MDRATTPSYMAGGTGRGEGFICGMPGRGVSSVVRWFLLGKAHPNGEQDVVCLQLQQVGYFKRKPCIQRGVGTTMVVSGTRCGQRVA